MIFIKYILIFFILMIFSTIGNLYSKKYVNRVEDLEKMKNMLNVFKAKIKFTGLTIQDIFNQLYEDNQDNIGEIFKVANEYMNDKSAKDAWNTALDDMKNKNDLNPEDINVLKSLGKMLGNTDIEGQVSQIELTENLLNEKIVEAQEAKKKNAKLYKTLGIATGLAIAIILI